MSLWAPATSSSYVGVTLPVLTNHQQIYELICAQTTWSLTEIFQILRITTQDDGRWYDFVFLGHLKSDFLCAKKNLFYQTKPALTFQKKRMKETLDTKKMLQKGSGKSLVALPCQVEYQQCSPQVLWDCNSLRLQYNPFNLPHCGLRFCLNKAKAYFIC